MKTGNRPRGIKIVRAQGSVVHVAIAGIEMRRLLPNSSADANGIRILRSSSSNRSRGRFQPNRTARVRFSVPDSSQTVEWKETADMDLENLTRMGTLNEPDEGGHSWHSVLHVFRGVEHVGDCSLGNFMSRCVFVCVCVIERGEERE